MIVTDMVINVPDLHFSFQFSLKETSVFLDHSHKIARVAWNGRVNLAVASQVLGYVSDLVESGIVDKVLLDRRELIHFDRKTRQWMKNELIRGRAFSLKHQIHKIAIINESSLAGNIYGKHVIREEDKKQVNLPIRKFDRPEDALHWILK